MRIGTSTGIRPATHSQGSSKSGQGALPSIEFSDEPSCPDPLDGPHLVHGVERGHLGERDLTVDGRRVGGEEVTTRGEGGVEGAAGGARWGGHRL